MSIERNHARRDSDARTEQAVDARQADKHVRETKRGTPMAETVDRFAAAMHKQAEPKKPALQPDAGRAQVQQQVKQDTAKSAEQSKLASEQAARAQDGATEQSAAQGLKDRSVERKHDSSDSASSESSHTDVATLWQSHMAMRNDAAPMPAPPAPVNTQVFSDLIQKHVRQLAASDNAGKDGDGQVLLRMSDATLPGTDLLLSRTENGWTLRADTRSRESFDAIRRAASDLSQRFANSDLGELTVEPYFNG